LKLRGKLFLLLLLIALAPVFGLALYEHTATTNLETELVERGRDIATEPATSRTTQRLVQMIAENASARQQVISILVIAMVIVAALAAFLSARSITRPVTSLVGAAKRLAVGDFSARAECGSGDEIGDLARAFNELGPQLEDRFRLQEDMDIAKEIQQSLLPTAAPEIPGFEVADQTVFCDETGGDYLDFLDIADLTDDESLAGYYGICVGDVAGHGIGAALQMASARALLHGLARSPLKLSRIIDGLNQGLTKDSHQGRFMTLFCCILAGPERNLYWISAGHDPAIVYDLAKDEFSELGGDDIPLGVDAGWRFQERQTGAMKPGRIIVIGTDGIWETRNAAGDMYGKERLLDVIRQYAESPAETIMTEILVHLDMFRGQAPVRDDVTVVLIKMV